MHCIAMEGHFQTQSDTGKHNSYEAKIEEIEEKRTALLLSAHMAPMMDLEELHDLLDPDILDRVLAFTVDDPYETCYPVLITHGAHRSQLQHPCQSQNHRSAYQH